MQNDLGNVGIVGGKSCAHSCAKNLYVVFVVKSEIVML